jgi:hypothetical protein
MVPEKTVIDDSVPVSRLLFTNDSDLYPVERAAHINKEFDLLQTEC